MKKLLLLAMALMPFAFMSCDNEKDDEGNVVVTGIEGTWQWDDTHHPFTITFKSNGKYNFETIGFKDEGSYTFSNNVISCRLSKRWSCETGWDANTRINVEGTWEETDIVDYNSRSYDVSLLEDGFIICTLHDEFYGAMENEIMLVNSNVRVTLGGSDLDGQWISRDGQEMMARLEVQGNSYTLWQREAYSQEPAATKEVGTWTYSKGYLTLSPSHLYFSSHHLQSGLTIYETLSDNLEAANWYEAEYEPSQGKLAAYKKGNTLYVSIPEAESVVKLIKQ